MSPLPFLFESTGGMPHLDIKDLSALAAFWATSATKAAGNRDSPQTDELINLSGSWRIVAAEKMYFLQALRASPNLNKAFAKARACCLAIRRKMSYASLRFILRQF